MNKPISLLLALLTCGTLAIAAGCNETKEGVEVTEGGAGKAVGIADKMSEGTVGGADEESGEDTGTADDGSE